MICHAVVIWCFRRVLERLSKTDLIKLINDPEMDIANASLTTYVADENGMLRLRIYCTKASDLRRLSANTVMLAVRTFDV